MVTQRGAPQSATDFIALDEEYGARNYRPLDVVVARAEGVWLWDVAGRRYLDCVSAYSALNHGHAHPRVRAALVEQAQRLSLTSRAMYNDRLPLFLERLSALTGYEAALPMNSGVEAVETALKLARRWGYEVKGIPANGAEIVVFADNFHGRTIAAISASSTAQYRKDFGPFVPGFTLVPFGDAAALARAITPRTCAVLLEPIQGEGGVVVPPEGFLAQTFALCRERDVLFVADEVQTGLGRTGDLFACDHESVRPDVLVLGKALGGGYYPVSAVASSRAIMDLFHPGDHGSTFGGNPLACAVAHAAIDALVDERLPQRAREAGDRILGALRSVHSPLLREVRGRGLLVGLEVSVPARSLSEALLRRGVVAKDTHENVLRIAPPLVIDTEATDFLIESITASLRELDGAPVDTRHGA
ncbi:MAG: ornithine--oxo-acid transaminase [Candidatus Tyrphobacter sp.]